MISKSPQRNTFQANSFNERLKEDPDDQSALFMSAYYQDWANRTAEKEADPEWQKDNLEYDLRTTDWILEKVRGDNSYAQNLYAAMCNNEFQRIDLWPILKGETCSYSWRYAGGIIADMRQEGDYIDWYCSGIRNSDDTDADGTVPESTVTEEVEQDLKRLGWTVMAIKSEDY